MAKKILPQEGKPAGVLLDELDEENCLPGANEVSYLVNVGTCLGIFQQRWVEDQFRKGRGGNEKANLNSVEMASMINSFRFDCVDCLNRDCPRRDPDAPFQEAKKRDEFYYEYSDGEAVDILGAGLKFSKSEMWDILIEAKIRTVGELCQRSENELRLLPGSSKEFVEELKAFLSKNGLHLYEPK